MKRKYFHLVDFIVDEKFVAFIDHKGYFHCSERNRPILVRGLNEIAEQLKKPWYKFWF